MLLRSIMFSLIFSFFGNIIFAQALSAKKKQVDLKNNDMVLKNADSLYYAADWPAAITLYARYLQHADSGLIWQRLGYAYQMAKNPLQAEMAYRRSLQTQQTPFMRTYIFMKMAEVFAVRNMKDSALSYVQQAAAGGSIDFNSVDSSAAFARMRADGVLTSVREQLYTNAYPCLKQEHSRDFDFWLGDWNVYITGTKTLIGKSHIIKEDGGCTIIEHYTSTTLPYSGHSINFYNPSVKSWEQLYVGSGGRGQLYTNGEYSDSAMRFSFTITAGDKKLPGHFIFYNLGPDRVRQFQDLSSDGGQTFKVSYDYTYERIK